MLSNTDAVLVILDYVARGAVLVLIWMLRQLFILDKKFALLEADQNHDREMAALESKKRDAQRKEILGAISKNSDKLDDHNSAVLTAIEKAVAGRSG